MRRKHQRGSAVVTTAIFATGLMVVAGLVADTGAMLYQRSRMQVATDAAALAGARGLADGHRKAIEQAKEVAAKNGYELAERDIKIQQGSRITVTLDRSSDSLVRRLISAMGEDRIGSSLTVGARSVADLHVLRKVPGPRPFAIPFCQYQSGAEYVLKMNAKGRSYFAVGADGVGDGVYRNAIMRGISQKLEPGDSLQSDLSDKSMLTVETINKLIGLDRTSYRQAQIGVETPRVITIPTYKDWHYQSRNIADVIIDGFVRYYVSYTTSQGEVYGRFLGKADEETSKKVVKYEVRLVDESEPLPPAYSVASVH